MIKYLFSLLLISFSALHSLAVEGMLIPSLLSAYEDDMKAFGMKLSAEEIYSVNNSSLKDAIMHFGGGCTAELVSGQGLLLTNHHCGYSSIQSHSSLENDYLKYGFWAKSQAEELITPGLTATRIVRMVNVTEAVFFGTAAMQKQEKYIKMKANMDKLVADARIGNHYGATIKAFNYGNDFYMIVTEKFLDVRLVGTPPNSIGKFGGDLDNWVWPRHTGDFSVFRVYADANNMPAEPSTTNRPYAPLHFLPVSLKSRVPGEFTMVYGFPGQTEQHLSSAHLKYIMEKERPARISMREKSLSVIDAGMESSDLIRIQYSAKQASIANGWKKWIGQLGGLMTVDAMQIKLDREAEYIKRAGEKEEWEKYKGVIQEMNRLIEQFKDVDFAYAMGIEYLLVGPEIFKVASSFSEFMDAYTNPGEKKREDLLADHRKYAESFFKNYDSEVDKKIFLLLTEEYSKQLKPELLPSQLKSQDLASLTEQIYSKSIFTSKERYMRFLEKMSEKTMKKIVKKDKGYALWKEVDDLFSMDVISDYRLYKVSMDELIERYIAGRKEMFPDEKLWPDANSTLRVTYGKLEGSAPHDGMQYTPFTTLDGIIAKNNTGHSDYELLPRMKELAKKKEYGPYAQDGELWVCFTGSNHTTGGNSGSPVIDGEGNLMGLNFDRTWESTMSDYMFDASRCRNIVVDMHYVLWVMDIYSGAGHLLQEMTIIR